MINPYAQMLQPNQQPLGQRQGYRTAQAGLFAGMQPRPQQTMYNPRPTAASGAAPTTQAQLDASNAADPAGLAGARARNDAYQNSRMGQNKFGGVGMTVGMRGNPYGGTGQPQTGFGGDYDYRSQQIANAKPGQVGIPGYQNVYRNQQQPNPLAQMMQRGY